MSYLRRLARRLTGIAPDNSLRPNVRRWWDSLDPFENWTIAPVTIPLTSKRLAETQIAERNDNPPPEINRPGVVKTEKPAEQTETGPVSRPVSKQVAVKGDSTRLKPVDEILQKKPADPTRIKTNDKSSGPDPILKSDSKSAAGKPKRLQSARTRSNAERDDSETDGDMGGSRLLGRLRQIVSTSRKAGYVAPVSGKPGSKPGAVTGLGPHDRQASAPLQPVYSRASPINKVARKKTVKSGAEAPRLVIGNLKVDVVAVDEKPKSRTSGAPVTRKTKSVHKRSIGGGVAKMKFGLGQM